MTGRVRSPRTAQRTTGRHTPSRNGCGNDRLEPVLCGAILCAVPASTPRPWGWGTVGDETPVVDLYDAIPKVELHCHVEGCVRPETVLQLARKAGRPLAVEDPTELRLASRPSIRSSRSSGWSRKPSSSQGTGSASRTSRSSTVAAHGLRYREMFFTPGAPPRIRPVAGRRRRRPDRRDRSGRGRRPGAMLADRRYGSSPRTDRGTGAGRAAGRAAAPEPRRAGRRRGHGLDRAGSGPGLLRRVVRARPTSRVPLHRPRRRGGRRGAREHPDRPRRAWPGYSASTTGSRSWRTRRWFRRMAAARIPLTVCPSSNVVIANRFPSLREHPFRAMREAGLLATINTDDPAMTDTDLGKEYRIVAEAQGLDLDDLAAIALDGIEASRRHRSTCHRPGVSQALEGLRRQAPADTSTPVCDPSSKRES